MAWSEAELVEFEKRTEALPSVFHSLAIVATIFRLIHRKWRKQFSSDDWWALIAAIFDLLVFVYSLLRVHMDDLVFENHRPFSAKAQDAIFVIASVAFTSTIWASRISIACSILRILIRGRTRTLVYLLTWIFFLNGILMLILKSYVCSRKNSWVDCDVGTAINLFKLCTDIISDSLLIVIPLFILWQTQLPKGPRYMISAVFVTSLCSITVCAVRVNYTLTNNIPLSGLTMNIEAAVTLLVCNLLVLVTFVYRLIRNGRDLDYELTEYHTHAFQRETAIVQEELGEFTAMTRSETTSSFQLATRRGSSIFLDANIGLFEKRGDDSLLTMSRIPTTSAPGPSSECSMKKDEHVVRPWASV